MKLTSSDSVQSYVNAVAQMRLGIMKQSEAKNNEPPIILPDTTISQLKGMEWLYQRFDQINTRHRLEGQLGECYRYALDASLERADLAYCEGQATGSAGIPLEHAWCININTGVVYDPTWKGKYRGTGYCGIPMSNKFVLMSLAATEYRGVLCNLWMAKTLWSEKLKDVVHPSYHAKVFHPI